MHNRQKVGQSRVITVVALGLLALGACGTEGAKKFAISDPMARAEAAVSEAQSVELEMTITQEMVFSAEGESAENTTEIHSRGVVELDASPRGKLESTIKTNTAGRTQELEQTIITDGTTAYTQVPGLASSGKKWLKVDTSEFAASSAGAESQTYLETLKALKDVDRLGEERIRNKDVTHYKGTLDWDYARSQLKPGNPTVKSLIDAMSESMKDAKVDVWVDEDDRPARVVTVVDLAGLSDQIGGVLQSMGIDPDEIPTDFEVAGTQTVEVDYLGYGGPIDVELPPADQVTEMNMSDIMAGASE